MRLIKKYPNRKFYDTQDKRYVGLSGIASLVRSGQDIQVVDNQTGDDLTAVVLSEILRQQARRDGFLPLGLLTALVRRGSASLEHLRDSFRGSLEAVRLLEDELHERIDSLAERGEIGLGEAQEFREELLARARDRESAVQERILREIEGSLDRLDLPSQQDLERLSRQLAEIEAKVDSLLSAP